MFIPNFSKLSIALRSAVLATFASVAAGQAFSQTPNACVNFVSDASPGIVRVNAGVPSVDKNNVAITFIGHSTFLIETAAGVRAATDYNDYVRPKAVPDIATMNRAHDTHFSRSPDPGIKHVLPGWDRSGGQAVHDITMQDMRVRNVTTNIRGSGLDIPDGNSIFVFEAAGLCIAHLGHLHHPLTPGHLKELGQIDIVLVPVDGSWTLDLAGMMDVLQSLSAKVMIPMHYFSNATLERFLSLGRDRKYTVERKETPRIVYSRDTLPSQPAIVILPGR